MKILNDPGCREQLARSPVGEFGDRARTSRLGDGNPDGAPEALDPNAGRRVVADGVCDHRGDGVDAVVQERPRALDGRLVDPPGIDPGLSAEGRIEKRTQSRSS